MDSPFEADATVKQVLEDYPQTASVFLNLKTVCVGCYLARFCALADVASFYQIPPEKLLEKLNKSIQIPTEE